MTLPNAQSSFCSSRARTVDAPLYGTAGTYETFLIVEWNRAMEPNVESQFPFQAFSTAAERTRWNDLLETLPTPRLQLVKQRGFSNDADGITLYIAAPRETNPLLYEFKLSRYTDLLDLNPAAMLTGDLEYRANLVSDPLYLVCTHGRRDPCCARRGLPVYQSLARYVGKPTVWQTSHIGGHRYAATMLAFPYGVYYGFVGDNEAPVIAQHNDAGRLYLPRYRGRTVYSKPVQAAEYYLRQHTGTDMIEAYRLLDTVADDDQWTIRFEDANAQTLTVTLRESLSSYHLPVSCSSEDEEPVRLYTRLEIT